MGFFSLPFVIECALSPDEMYARIRSMVEQRLLPDSRWFRLQQLRGWVLEERSGEFMLRSCDLQSRSAYDSRFVGRVESSGAGSRMVGEIRTHRLFSTIMTILMLFVTVAIVGFFLQHRPDLSGLDRETVKSVSIYILLMGAMVGMTQASLRMAAKTIREGVAFAVLRVQNR